MNLTGWVDPQAIAAAAEMLPGDLAVAAACLVGTALLVALCVPGILMPTAIAAGALLGPWAGVGIVVGGAVFGSQILFAASRRLPSRTYRFRHKLDGVHSGMARHGLWYVAVLRVVGVPHFLVTVASASTPIRGRSFLAANAIGFFPALWLAAMAGSAL